MSSLKGRLENDMKTAMKDRDEVTLNTLRMALTAVKNAEVSGKEARELSDAEVEKVLAKQAKQRRESAEAFQEGGRAEQAQRERDEEEVLARYLPQPLSASELDSLVDEVLSQGGFDSLQQMGSAMKAVQSKVAGRADGKLVADAVKQKLAG